MKNLRFKLAIGKNLVFILTSLPKARRMIKQTDKYSDNDRLEFALEIMSRMCKASKSKIAIYGEENLPKESGFMMCPNHQGKFDGIAVLDSYKKPCRVLWRADTADKFVARECCGLISARTIDVEHNLLGALRTINAVGDDLKEKITYVIFPEGGYTDNKNNLQEFKSGCFRAALRSKAPIVPVCLYDSWKMMNYNKFGWITMQLHYLKPIPYEEYGELKVDQIAALVKSRIQERMDEIKNGTFVGTPNRVLYETKRNKNKNR